MIGIKAVNAFMVVVLPDPLLPIRVTISPCFTSKEIPFIMGTPL